RLFLLGVRRDDDALTRRQLAALEDGLDLLGVERLALDERVGERVELLAAERQELADLAVLLLDDPADLLVDLDRGLLGVVLLARAVVAAEEDLLFLLAVRERPELLAHAPLAHHLARDVRRLLDVVARARRHAAEDDLLRDAPAERHGDRALGLLFREV